MNYSAREVQAAYRMGLTGLGKFLSKSCIIYKTDIGCGSVEPYFNIYHHILYINHVSSYIIYKPYLRSAQLELLTCCAHVPVRKGTRGVFFYCARCRPTCRLIASSSQRRLWREKKSNPCCSWHPCFTAARPLNHVFVFAAMPLKPVSAARPLSHVVALAAKSLKLILAA